MHPPEKVWVLSYSHDCTKAQLGDPHSNVHSPPGHSNHHLRCHIPTNHKKTYVCLKLLKYSRSPSSGAVGGSKLRAGPFTLLTQPPHSDLFLSIGEHLPKAGSPPGNQGQGRAEPTSTEWKRSGPAIAPRERGPPTLTAQAQKPSLPS